MYQTFHSMCRLVLVRLCVIFASAPTQTAITSLHLASSRCCSRNNKAKDISLGKVLKFTDTHQIWQSPNVIFDISNASFIGRFGVSQIEG